MYATPMIDDTSSRLTTTSQASEQKIVHEDLEFEDSPGAKVRWMTRSMAEDFTRHDVLYTTFKEALLYSLFVAAVTICTIGRRSNSFFYLTQALKGQFLEKDFSTAYDVEIKFYDIKSPTDFWHYTESLLVDSFYWEHYVDSKGRDEVESIHEDDKNVLFENKLLGVPRIRQVRVKNDSCEVHAYFEHFFSTCYNSYIQAENEDRDPFGPKKGTAWTYNTPEETKSVKHDGEIASYGAGGYYVDLATSREESVKMLASLKENLWISRATRAVFIDFTIYNPNLNLFCICKLILEFPPTGGIVPTHSFQTVHLVKYVVMYDYFTLFFEILMYLFLCLFTAEEVREILYFKKRYFMQFWTFIDLTIIAMDLAYFITSVIVFVNVDEAITKIRHNPRKYGNMEFLGEMKIIYNNFAASLLFFTYIKMFKYLNFNKTMGQLNNTLKRCALDLLGFAIMFFVIFLAFAALGYLLFGSKVADFYEFGMAMFTLLRTILGDFDFDAIYRANKILAPCYFISYIFLVFFVLLNMFLAIINDTYADVKTEIAITPDEMQMTEFLKRGFYKFMRRLGCKMRYVQAKVEVNPTEEKIRSALRKCGFSDLEIEMFFSRYNIDPLAEVGEYDGKKIMKELDAEAAKEKMDENAFLVHVTDFITQKERLDRIENNLLLVGVKIDSLIRRLGELALGEKLNI